MELIARLLNWEKCHPVFENNSNSIVIDYDKLIKRKDIPLARESAKRAAIKAFEDSCPTNITDDCKNLLKASYAKKLPEKWSDDVDRRWGNNGIIDEA